MTFGYLIPITPREMPFRLDVMDAKNRVATSPYRTGLLNRLVSTKKS